MAETNQEVKKKPLARQCASFNCGKEAIMQCPICIKKGLVPTYFCSQQCFKSYWKFHQIYHDDYFKENPKFKNYKFTGKLRNGRVSQKLFVPDHIPKPDYAANGHPREESESKWQNEIEIKSKEDLDKMRRVGVLARQVLDLAGSLVKPGVTTDYIDQEVHKFCIENDAYPSPLNYYEFPKSLTTSVNEVICHGIPDDRPLENGDIVNCDITIYKEGFNLDLDETYVVGETNPDAKFLIQKTFESFEKAQQVIKPGARYNEIGNVIGKYIEENGLSVVKQYTGHGIGKLFHTAPTVYHYKNNHSKEEMKVGHVFTIEPMVNQGTFKLDHWPDGWTAVTKDGKWSAQFENTFVVTEGGFECLTKKIESSPGYKFY